MPADNNPFVCNVVKVRPPYGPFSSRESEKDDHNFNICPANTFGPYKTLVNFQLESEKSKIKYQQAMTGISTLTSGATFLLDIWGTIIAAKKNAQNELLEYCIRRYIFKDIDNEDSYDPNLIRNCYDIIKQWGGSTLDTTLTKGVAKTINYKSQAAKSGFESLIGPLDNWNDEKIYTIARVGTGGIGFLANSLENIRSYQELRANNEYVGTIENHLMKDCKYASSFTEYNLFYCNFNDGTSGSSAPGGKDRQCYMPLQGHIPQLTILGDGSINVASGIKVVFNESLSVYGTYRLVDFLGALGRNVSLGHTSGGSTNFNQIKLFLNESAANPLCDFRDLREYRTQSATSEVVEVKGGVMNCYVPAFFNIAGSNLDDIIVSSGGLSLSSILVGNHVDDLDQACHALAP